MKRRALAAAAAAGVTLAGLVALVSCASAIKNRSVASTSPATVAASPSEHRYGSGPVIFVLGVSSSKITTAQDVRLSITARSKPGWQVSFPVIGASLGQFTVAARSSRRSRLESDGYTLRERDYLLEPFLAGSYEIPPLTLTANGSHQTIHVQSNALTVSVESLIPKGTEKPLVLKSASGPIALPDAFPEIFAGAVILFAALSATLIFLIGRALRRRQGHEEGVPPWVSALRELDRLVELDLPTKGRHKEFYHRISQLVRHYVEEMFGVNAPDQTTEEFLFAVRDSPALGRHRRILGEFLSHCDLVKFASYLPAQDEVHRAVRSCRAFIDSSSGDLKNQAGGGSQQR